MLTGARLVEFAEAPSFDEAARILADCGYPDLTGASDGALEEAFAARRLDLFREMEKFCPEKELVAAFRLKYDYHNAKVLVKAQAAGMDGTRLLSPCGRIDPRQLAAAFAEEDWRDIPPAFAAAVQEARVTLAKTRDPQLSDIGLDKAYFAEMLSLTAALSTDLYNGYVRLCIDIANLRSAVRCLRGHMDEGVLRAAVIPGGNISPERVCRSYAEGVTAVFDDRALAPCAELGQQAVEGGPLAGFERTCDNVLTDYLTRAKRVPFGPEVVIAHLAALEGEIVSARTVLLGKRGGLSSEVLRERLRDSYV